MEVLFIETSAKAGFNVKGLFRKVGSSLPDAGVTTPAASVTRNADCK